MPDETIPDDEVLLRRIPSGKPWFEPPDRISSMNFKLRRDDVGLSVYREKFISAEQLLQKPDSIPGSFVVKTTVGEVRRLKNGKGDELHLDVIPIDDEEDKGHAEIRGKFSNSVSESLKRVFQRVAQPPTD